MEMLRLSGYSEEEKIEIARRYLIARQLRETGLTIDQFAITDEALRDVVGRYTREAGVRQLERTIGRLARQAALNFAQGNTEPIVVHAEDLPSMLGPELFFAEHARKELPAGVSTGLAWTETGGEVLYVEAALLPGGRGLSLTGQLGEVMQESARAAHSYIWSQCEELHIDRGRFRTSGVHVHVPSGAIPKDGPSAGVTMAAAMTSLFTGFRVRSDTAMTGEVTLSGIVLPIGGVKEKILAARRAGLRRIILPEHNRKDLLDLPEDIRAELEFVFVERIPDVLAAAIPELTQAAPALTAAGR
jgi:ATP-dependent Lon protease